MKFPKLFGRKKAEDDDDEDDDAFEDEELEIVDLDELENAPVGASTSAAASAPRRTGAEKDVLDDDVMVGGEDRLENPFDGEDDDEDDDYEDDDDEDGDGSSRKKALLFAAVGIGVVLSSAIGGASWWYFSADAAPAAAENSATRIEMAMPAAPGSLNSGGGVSLNALAAGAQSGETPPAAETPATTEAAGPAAAPSAEPAAAPVAPPTEAPASGGFGAPTEAAPQLSMNSMNALGAAQAGGGVVVSAVAPEALARLPDLPSSADQSQALANAPVRALLEDKDGIGQLPKIASNGAEAWQVYARPVDPSLTLPRVAIMIEGVGLSRQASLAAINKLPPAVSLALSPYGRNLEDWVFRSRLAGHEVFMMLPLESEDFPIEDAGPLALDTRVQFTENQRRLETVMAAAGGYAGMVTYMGSRFIKAEGQVRKVMEVLKQRGLMLAVGGRQTRNDAIPIAKELNVVHVESQFYLDDTPSIQEIRTNLDRAVSMAKDKGSVLVMARPYPVTISSIIEWLKTLPDTGVALVPASAVAAVQSAAQ